MTQQKLLYKIFIEGKISVLSGLHIGGSDAGLGLAGSDITILRNPSRNPPEPFIPGSSLKGKLRALYERMKGEFGPPANKMRGVAGPSDNAGTLSGKLFGVSSASGGGGLHSARLIVYDCPLNAAASEKIKSFGNLERPYAEVKREASIDRVTAAVTPREIERVVEGAEFDMKLILNIFGEDDALELVKALAASLSLLNDDYLGGHGSRGYGRVKITINKDGLVVKNLTAYEESKPAPALAETNPELVTPFEPLFA